MQQALLNSLQEVKEQFEALELKLGTVLPTVTTILPPTAVEPNMTLNGMTPALAMKAFMPWVDAPTLTNVVSQNLDTAHFIKLIPTKQRPKGQTNTGLASGIHIDGETGKASVVNESNVQYERQFPDYPTLVNALTVYVAIRDLYDVDKLDFRCAITLYIRQLALWTKLHKWTSIVSYFVSHFDKYQSSQDPRSWIDVDLQSFIEHLTNDTLDTPNTGKVKVLRKTHLSAVCNNWNTKGCTWKGCQNLHVCIHCRSENHTDSRCPTIPKSS